MKHYFFFLIPVLIACKKGKNYEVLTKSKVIEKNECSIPVDFPQISWKQKNEDANEINQMLESLPEHEFYARNCSSEYPQNVIGNFKILLETDSLLSIEYQTHIKYKDQSKIIFHSIVINPNKNFTNGFASIIVEPKHVIKGFGRDKILPYVEKYNESNNANINILAYQKDSNYAISWGISDSHIIIYVGGEGEFFGTDKIEIPLNEQIANIR